MTKLIAKAEPRSMPVNSIEEDIIKLRIRKDGNALGMAEITSDAARRSICIDATWG